MARFDRCSICDYSEAHGSSIAGLPPGHNGKVRRHGDDLLCDTCLYSIGDTLSGLEKEDKEE
jgi:hypothetical protein